jgi:hypothetical protein
VIALYVTPSFAAERVRSSHWSNVDVVADDDVSNQILSHPSLVINGAFTVQLSTLLAQFHTSDRLHHVDVYVNDVAQFLLKLAVRGSAFFLVCA